MAGQRGVLWHIAGGFTVGVGVGVLTGVFVVGVGVFVVGAGVFEVVAGGFEVVAAGVEVTCEP